MTDLLALGDVVPPEAGLPALPELPTPIQSIQPDINPVPAPEGAVAETPAVEADIKPAAGLGDEEEYVPEAELGPGDGESDEEEEEYEQEVASSNGSVYGEEAKPRIVVGLRGAAAKANAAAVLRKGGRPRKNPEDPKWIISDDDEPAPRRRQSQQPVRVKAPPPTFGPNTRIVRRQRFKTTSADGEDRRKGRPRKNPNDPKWKRIDALREASEAAAVAAGGGKRKVKREETEGLEDEGEEGEGDSEFGSLAEGSPFGEVATPARKGTRARKSLLNPDGSTKKRGRPLGSKNKPKGSPSAADLENGNISGSDFEAELPPAKKPRAPRGSRKSAAAALADDPTQPGYGTPVQPKWTRNPNAVRQSSRKAAVTKYDDAEVQMAVDDSVMASSPAPAEPAAATAPKIEEVVPEPVTESVVEPVVESVQAAEVVPAPDPTPTPAPAPEVAPVAAPVAAVAVEEKLVPSAPAPAPVETVGTQPVTEPKPAAVAPPKRRRTSAFMAGIFE